MNATVNDIVQIIEGIAPPNLAESWDNVGLQVGRRSMAVKKLLVALDASPEVVAQAIDQEVQMIITHHPLVFEPVKKLIGETWQNKLLLDCAENKIAVYSAHTSLDSVFGGVSDVLAAKFGMEHADVLVPILTGEAGFGRIDSFETPMELEKFVEIVKQALELETVLVGDAGKMVQKIAVCGGSGADFIEAALNSGADTFVTGDIKYHAAQDAVFCGLNIIDAGHQGTELPMINKLADRLALRLGKNGFNTQVLVAKETKLMKCL